MVHTILTLGLGLVQYHIVDTKVRNVAHIEGHDVIVTGTNVVIGILASAVGLSIVGRQKPFDHLEDISQLGRVQGGARQHTGVLLAISQCDDAR
jgi:hypothetical protein